MKAAVYRHRGGPEVLSYETVPDPVPGETDLLIRVEAISIEGGDMVSRAQLDPGGQPKIVGYAAAGEVIAIGAKVSGFSIGQKVTGFAFDGSHAELRAMPAATCWAVPDGLDLGVAAAIPCGLGTSALALELGGLAKGQSVLVLGAAGGVGIGVVQLAHLAGARVIGTGTSAASLARLKDYGLDDAIVAGDGPVDKQVRALLGGGGADIVVDNIGGSALNEGIRALADGGRAVLVGVLGGAYEPVDPFHLMVKRKAVIGCLLGAVMHEPAQQRMIAGLIDRVAAGEIQVPTDRTFPLSEAAAAHARGQERGRIGRVIMVP